MCGLRRDRLVGHQARHLLASCQQRGTGIRRRATPPCSYRRLAKRHAERFRTITADNGTEFHSYPAIERALRLQFYFATPHHAWERGTNENTNGLIR